MSAYAHVSDCDPMRETLATLISFNNHDPYRNTSFNDYDPNYRSVRENIANTYLVFVCTVIIWLYLMPPTQIAKLCVSLYKLGTLSCTIMMIFTYKFKYI